MGTRPSTKVEGSLRVIPLFPRYRVRGPSGFSSKKKFKKNQKENKNTVKTCLTVAKVGRVGGFFRVREGAQSGNAGGVRVPACELLGPVADPSLGLRSLWSCLIILSF